MDKKVEKRNAMNRPAARMRRGRESPRNKLLLGSDGDKNIPPSIRIAMIATHEL
jgi:hypothetical protein